VPGLGHLALGMARAGGFPVARRGLRPRARTSGGRRSRVDDGGHGRGAVRERIVRRRRPRTCAVFSDYTFSASADRIGCPERER
jgi:hypothetical protein